MLPVFLPDRYPKATLKEKHPSVHAAMDAKGLLDGQNELVRFVGIADAGPEKCVCFLPHGVSLGDKVPRIEVARSVMAAVATFARQNARPGEANSDEPAITFVALMAEIAEDYRDNGIFSERLHQKSLNTGKPDWSATVRKELPILTATGAPVYTDIRTVRPFTSTENILAIIQTAIIHEIAGRHGWWLEDSFGNRELPSLKHLPAWPREIWSSMLRRFKRNLFADSAIRLASLLESYLELSPRSGRGSTVCGISDFSTVWEAMLVSTLPNVLHGMNARLPFARYQPRDRSVKPVDRFMRTDIIAEEKGIYYLLDAKYYMAKGDSTLPGWSDVAKQFVYELALRDIIAPDARILNGYIFPSDKNRHIPFDRVEMVGRSGSATDFPIINVYGMNITEVMSSYVSGTKLGNLAIYFPENLLGDEFETWPTS